MKSTYYCINACTSCDATISNSQRMYSNGICKFCGNTDNSTIVDTIKKTIKQTRINPLWKFWRKQFKREVLTS